MNERTLVYVATTTTPSFDHIIGMVVLPYKIDVIRLLTDNEHNAIINKVIRKFGFSTEEEYQTSYPGNYIGGSITWGTSKSRKSKDAVDEKYPMFYAMDYTKRRKLSDAITSNAMRSYDKCGIGYMLVAQPTINEMRNVYGYKTISNKDLWMCSDWKDK